MYLPSYKLNNSYTVYVNYVYLNDCIKASKEVSIKNNCTHAKTSSAKVSITTPPLAANTHLRHKQFGVGKVLTTQNGIMKVEFKNKVAQFLYPDAIRQGHLVLATC